jgi:hypothetical protein
LIEKQLPQYASARIAGPVRLPFLHGSTPKSGFPNGTLATLAAYPVPVLKEPVMLIERGLRVMHVEVVGDAYAIASNYLRRTGAINEGIATNARLLAIIMEIFQRGEFNKIRLANKAIVRFEAESGARAA